MSVELEVLQIAILYLLIYALLKGARGSRFGQTLTGVLILVSALFVFTYLFHFYVLAILIKYLLLYLIISSVVIFQPEIRRILASVGALEFFEKRKYRPDGAATGDLLVEAVGELSSRRIGALIAFERGISLRSYEETGVPVDARVSRQLFTCIFTPPLPLHDGGMVIRGGRIASAHCIFPVSNNPELVCSGMRHRAAVGLSEETDALVVVVSEESGIVSVAHNGKLFRCLGSDSALQLRRWISKALSDRVRERGLINRFADRMQAAISGQHQGASEK